MNNYWDNNLQHNRSFGFNYLHKNFTNINSYFKNPIHQSEISYNPYTNIHNSSQSNFPGLLSLENYFDFGMPNHLLDSLRKNPLQLSHSVTFNYCRYTEDVTSQLEANFKSHKILNNHRIYSEQLSTVQIGEYDESSLNNCKFYNCDQYSNDNDTYININEYYRIYKHLADEQKFYCGYVDGCSIHNSADVYLGYLGKDRYIYDCNEHQVGYVDNQGYVYTVVSGERHKIIYKTTDSIMDGAAYILLVHLDCVRVNLKNL